MPLSNWRDAADRIRCLLQNNINMKELLRKISNWYFSRKALPYWCILVMDCMAVYVSGLFVYYLQHGGLELAQYFWQVTFGLGFVSHSVYHLLLCFPHLQRCDALL